MVKVLPPVNAHSLLVYKRGFARVRPYPFHAVLDEVGLILGATSKKGAPTVQTQKPEDQAQVAPTDFGENATNPVFGRTQTWRTFHLGMGLPVEDADPTKPEGRYRWAINADCSVASRLAMKGPDIRHIVPSLSVRDDVFGVPKFFDLNGSLYYLNGRHLMRVDDDENCTKVGDFGADRIGVDVAVFASNFYPVGTPSYAYIAVLDSSALRVPGPPGAPPVPHPPDQTGEFSDTPMWRFDGTTLAAHPAMTARALCVIGRDLYRANGRNQISSVDVDTDPWVEANWRAENQYLIGDRSSAIVSLVCNAVGALVVLKTDGVYSVDAAGEQIRYYPFLKFGQQAGNGANWGVFMNDVYARYAEALYKIDPDFNIDEVGPNRVGTVDGPVKGRTTAFAGHGNFHAYTGMWDPDTDTAFLMKYGSHQTNELGEPQRIEAWHGSVSYPAGGNRITALHVSPWGAPASHNRMYLGYRDGRVGFFTLPCVPDAAACVHYTFSLDPSWVVMPNWHGGFPSDQKPLRHVAVGGDNLSSANYATVGYRLDPVSADATLGMPWVALPGNFDTLPTERIAFPDATQCFTAAFRIELHSSVVADSPLVTSFSLRWRLVTDFTQVYSMVVLAEDGLVCRDGTPLRRGAKAIRDHVRGVITRGDIVRLILPDEDVKLVSVIGYGEAIGWYERQERWASGIKIQVAEDATGGTYGTYKRLLNRKYGDLLGMKYGDLLTL
jgi:hypothetical protein